MTHTVLIIEDNQDLSELLGIYLSGFGYEISRAENSSQGISKALAERPDVIITDLHLPDMNGVEATAVLKNNPVTSKIPIIVLTAMSVGEWKKKALKAGVAEYLVKPISPPDLVETVRKLTETVRDQTPSLLTEL